MSLCIISSCKYLQQRQGSSDLSARGNAIGNFKGVKALERQFMSSTGRRINLASFLKEGGSAEFDRLEILLGHYSSGSGDWAFDNDTPNGVNMLLYKQIFRNLSHSIAANCRPVDDSLSNQTFDSNGKIIISPMIFHKESTQLILKNACNRMEGEELSDIWNLFIGYGSSDEFESWRIELDRHGITKIDDKVMRLQLVLYTLFLNPHYLLES
jgi:hypothetical protein